MRVRRNCSKKDDYDLQAKILIDRFEEKGYCSKDLVQTKIAVREMKREDLFKKKEASKRDFGVAFMTGLARPHKQIEKIIHKHRPLLLKDVDLNKILPTKP